MYSKTKKMVSAEEYHRRQEKGEGLPEGGWACLWAMVRVQVQWPCHGHDVMSRRCEAAAPPQGTVLHSCQASWDALTFSSTLQRNTVGPSEARLFFREKCHLRSTRGKNCSSFIFYFLNSPVSGVSVCQGGYSTQGAVHTLSLARLHRAEQSPEELSRAEPSALSPLIRSLSPGAVMASRELRRRNFPHPLPPSVFWQQDSNSAISRCPHPSSKAFFILVAFMPW